MPFKSSPPQATHYCPSDTAVPTKVGRHGICRKHGPVIGQRTASGNCDPAVIRRPARTSRDAEIDSNLVGGPGFEPGASRSRTVVALGSGSVARGRLSSPRPRLQSATCRYVSVDAARVATCVATRLGRSLCGKNDGPARRRRDRESNSTEFLNPTGCVVGSGRRS